MTQLRICCIVFQVKGQGHNALIIENCKVIGKMIPVHNSFSLYTYHHETLHRLPMSSGCALLILESKGQRLISEIVCMPLHTQICHESFRVSCCDSGVKRSRSQCSDNWKKVIREKEEIWLSPMTEALTQTEKSKKQRDNTKNATKNFDYTMIADRLRTVSWGNDSHPAGVVKPVYGIPAFPLTAKAV